MLNGDILPEIAEKLKDTDIDTSNGWDTDGKYESYKNGEYGNYIHESKTFGTPSFYREEEGEDKEDGSMRTEAEVEESELENYIYLLTQFIAVCEAVGDDERCSHIGIEDAPFEYISTIEEAQVFIDNFLQLTNLTTKCNT